MVESFLPLHEASSSKDASSFLLPAMASNLLAMVSKLLASLDEVRELCLRADLSDLGALDAHAERGLRG